MLAYPLTRTHRLRLAQAFAAVPRVDISIACAVEDQMGEAFVDSPDDPAFFMIEQDRFFCYVAGDFSTTAGRDFLRDMPGGRFIMSGSPGWQEGVESVFGERVKPVERYSYAADSLSPEHLQKLMAANPHTAQVQRIGAALANSNPRYLGIGAFDSPDDFVQRGIGFCLLKDGVSIGSAYSSLVCSSAIEVSIVVDERYHRQGIATALAYHLLQWCLERRLRPNWDAANQRSCALAENLGYTKAGTYTAYYIHS